MVMAFFRGGSGDGFDNIVQRSAGMLADARHSFDLATLALLTGSGADSVSADVHETDNRINATEQELRSELVVHVSVHGQADVGSVLGFTLLLKRIERIGDQAKNILDLAENGISLADAANNAELLEQRQAISTLFAEAGELLSDANATPEAIEEYSDRASDLAAQYQAEIDGFMTTDRPGREVVPLAIFYRYLRRIVANLVGVVRVSVDPFPQMGYLDGGAVDTDD